MWTHWCQTGLTLASNEFDGLTLASNGFDGLILVSNGFDTDVKRVCYHLSLRRAFKENPDMFELVLPTSLEPVELRCAEEVARELGLETEKVGLL